MVPCTMLPYDLRRAVRRSPMLLCVAILHVRRCTAPVLRYAVQNNNSCYLLCDLSCYLHYYIRYYLRYCLHYYLRHCLHYYLRRC